MSICVLSSQPYLVHIGETCKYRPNSIEITSFLPWIICVDFNHLYISLLALISDIGYWESAHCINIVKMQYMHVQCSSYQHSKDAVLFMYNVHYINSTAYATMKIHLSRKQSH